jgi:hypothetical protein
MAKMTPASEEINVGSRRMILAYGPSKAGKTTFSVNLMGKENTVMIAFDHDGVKSVLPMDVFYIDPKRPWEDWLDTVPELQKLKGKKTCINVSDLTTAGRLMLYTAGTFKDPRKAYGIAIDHIIQMVNTLKFEFTWATVILEACDVFVEEENEKIVSTLPNVIGKSSLAPALPGMVDEVFYFKLPITKKVANPKTHKLEDQTERFILTSSDGIKLAGNRINKAGQELILDLNEEISIGIDGDMSKLIELRRRLRI